MSVPIVNERKTCSYFHTEICDNSPTTIYVMIVIVLKKDICYLFIYLFLCYDFREATAVMHIK